MLDTNNLQEEFMDCLSALGWMKLNVFRFDLTFFAIYDQSMSDSAWSVTMISFEYSPGIIGLVL
jgi:hypothetical protein